MRLSITSVVGHGDQTHERIHFTVLQDCNLSGYIVADTTFTGDRTLSNKVRHTHWFPSIQVKGGDAVVLYTRDGVPVSQPRKDGGTNHFLYWGLNEPVWNDFGDGALLFEIDDWQGRRVR
jgi:hypothetical protein